MSWQNFCSCNYSFWLFFEDFLSISNKTSLKYFLSVCFLHGNKLPTNKKTVFFSVNQKQFMFHRIKTHNFSFLTKNDNIADHLVFIGSIC